MRDVTKLSDTTTDGIRSTSFATCGLTCSTQINLETEGDIIRRVEIVKGCDWWAWMSKPPWTLLAPMVPAWVIWRAHTDCCDLIDLATFIIWSAIRSALDDSSRYWAPTDGVHTPLSMRAMCPSSMDFV